jgi:hypothetical protein
MGLPPFQLRTETDPVSETLCSLEYQTVYKFQKLSNPENLGSIPGGDRDSTFHVCIQAGSGAHPTSSVMGSEVSFPVVSTRDLKLTTDLRVVPMFGMRGAYPLLHNTFSWHGA